MVYEPWITITLASAALSLALCLLLTPLAHKAGLLDHPSEREVHGAPIPLVGGLAVFIAWAVATFLTSPFASQAIPMVTACGLMLITGLKGDLYELSPYPRFSLQIVACLIMIFAGGVVLEDFGSLMWDGVLPLGWLSIPITIFAALGVINAFNMMDGIDGLSSMILMVAATAMAWLALRAGLVFNASMLIIVAGAVLGFFLMNARLPWNKRGRVLLGDSGSVFLGMFLAWQFIELGSGTDRAFTPITAVWLLGIPLMDTTALMARRWRAGGSSLHADQHHLHHAFLKAGFSVAQTGVAITLMVLFTTAIGLAGLLLGWPEYLMFYGYLALCGVYLLIMRRCWRHGRFLGRDMASELICWSPLLK